MKKNNYWKNYSFLLLGPASTLRLNLGLLRRPPMPRKRREQKLCEEFEAEGIYTIEKLLELVSKLSKLEKTSDCLDWDLKEWLYENSEAFPPEEFQKLLDLENHCTPEQYKAFRSVTNNWHFSAISSSISDKHIQLVAENPDAFAYAYDDIFPKIFPWLRRYKFSKNSGNVCSNEQNLNLALFSPQSKETIVPSDIELHVY